MAFLAPALPFIAAGTAIAGTALAYKGSRDAAKAAERQAEAQAAIDMRGAELEAAHMEQQAVLSVASAQRAMLEERRQAQLLQSRALAVAGASGAGVSDKTVVDVIAGIAAEGSYRQSIALYEGMERSRQLRVGAQIRREGGHLEAEYGRAAGRDQASAYRTQATASLLQGAGSLAARYSTPNKAPAGSFAAGADFYDD